MHTPSYKRMQILQFSTYIFSADATPKLLKLCRVTKVKVFFLVQVYVLKGLILTYLNLRSPFWRRVYYINLNLPSFAESNFSAVTGFCFATCLCLAVIISREILRP